MSSENEMEKFKNSMGIFFGRELFFETATPPYDNVLYTLKDHDHKGYKSISRIFLLLNDPTEYKIATQYFGGLKHWQKLKGTKWFSNELAKWQEELELKLQSEGLERLIAESRGGDKNSFAASKYLLEKGWQKKPVGRVSNKKIQEAAQGIYEANQLQDHEQDILKEYAS